jgi:hypothetical protein
MHVECMGRKINSYRLFIEKLGDPSNIKILLSCCPQHLGCQLQTNVCKKQNPKPNLTTLFLVSY